MSRGRARVAGAAVLVAGLAAIGLLRGKARAGSGWETTGVARQGAALEGRGAVTAATRPAALREVEFEQRLDQEVPLDLPLRDENGRAVRLGDYLGRRPVVLQLAY